MIHHYSKLVIILAREPKSYFHLLILRRKSLRRQTPGASAHKINFALYYNKKKSNTSVYKLVQTFYKAFKKSVSTALKIFLTFDQVILFPEFILQK